MVTRLLLHGGVNQQKVEPNMVSFEGYIFPQTSFN